MDSGAVFIDGQDIRRVSLGSLRAAIGIVPQDTVLFNDTLRANVVYGRQGAHADDVLRAVRLAALDGAVRSMPGGLDTHVGERGLKLSGGEKQRVAIARAVRGLRGGRRVRACASVCVYARGGVGVTAPAVQVLKDAPILLCDEATSSLDSHTETSILTALKAVAASRTTLIIAHRLSTIADADEIVVLGGGRVVERGSHFELIQARGAYFALWRQQQLAEAERSRRVGGAPRDGAGAAGGLAA